MVAQAVVDFLEAVEVDEHQGQAAFFALGDVQAGLELLLQHVAVGQRGQCVVQGHVLQLVLGLVAGAHVVRHEQKAGARTVFIAQLGHENLGHQAGAVAAHHAPLGGQAG